MLGLPPSLAELLDVATPSPRFGREAIRMYLAAFAHLFAYRSKIVGFVLVQTNIAYGMHNPAQLPKASDRSNPQLS